MADAVIEARKMSLWKEDSRKALKLSAFRVYDSIDRVRGSIRRRKKKERAPESEYAAAVSTILSKVARLAELEMKMEGDRSSEWRELKRRLNAVKTSPNPRQVVAELKLKSLSQPTGGHSVAPSVAPSEVVGSVAARMPSDVLVVTIKKEGVTTQADYSFVSRSELRAGANYDDVMKIPAVARLLRAPPPPS